MVRNIQSDDVDGIIEINVSDLMDVDDLGNEIPVNRFERLERPKAGRPKKTRAELKSRYISVRVSRPEYSAITKRANRRGQRLSDYVREKLAVELKCY